MPLQQNNSPVFQFPQVRVVEASAGSGKTYALAKRYIQLLLNPALKQQEIPLRQILAITFTNKSALEMKERILSFLKRIALDQLSAEQKEDLILTILPDAKPAQEKAFGIMDHLIHNYNFFQVQTIDSFINALLSGCAFRIGLSANFRIKRNDVDYLEFSLDELIDRARGDKKLMGLFQQFLHQYLYLENRTSWFPKKDMVSLIRTLFAESNTFGYGFEIHPSGNKDRLSLRKKFLQSLEQLLELLPEKTDARFRTSLENFLQKTNVYFDLDDLSNYFSREEFPVTKNGEVPAKVDRLWAKIRASLRELSETEAFSLFNCYIEIFDRVLEGFALQASKDDVLFLSELNKKARRLFDEEGMTVEELYYRLATRFRHYLIDEFQDTSLLQWRNLHLMVEEALSTGGSLFYVGDKKQAIYGFRGGEVALFDELKRRFAAFNVQTEVLSTNYRSQKWIVEFNNSVFSESNLERFMTAKDQYEQEKNKKDAIGFSREDRQEILSVFHDSHQTFLKENSEGYVNVEFLEADNRDELLPLVREKLIKTIKDLQPRFSYRGIAILARGNKEVELVTSWLMEAGIGVDSERTSNIKENFLIKEVISLLRFLNSPIDNLAFSCFILGDIFLSASGIPAQTIHDFLFEIRERRVAEKDLYVYREFRARFPKVWEDLLEEFFRNVGLFPLYELIVSIFHRFDCVQRFPSYQGFLMKFLQLVKDQEEENADIASFLEFFEETQGDEFYVNVGEADCVRVLTIHKSKGLEFPAVLIPFLEMDVQAGSGGSQGERPYTTVFNEDHLNLVHLKKKYLTFSPVLKELYAREYRKSFLAELNSIYVALTRAEKELYVFVPKKAGNSFNLVNLLIPPGVAEFGRKIDYPAKPRGARPVPIRIPPFRHQDWLHLLRDEFAAMDLVVDRQKALQGDTLHYILSLLGNLHEADPEAALGSALQMAETAFPSAQDFPGITKRMRQLLKQPQLKNFFYVPKGIVYQEKDLVSVHGQMRRVDRLIVQDKEVWIVDYKSAREPSGQYREQVLEYMAIASSLYPNRTVKGFLLYLDDFGLEEVRA